MGFVGLVKTVEAGAVDEAEAEVEVEVGDSFESCPTLRSIVFTCNHKKKRQKLSIIRIFLQSASHFLLSLLHLFHHLRHTPLQLADVITRCVDCDRTHLLFERVDTITELERFSGSYVNLKQNRKLLTKLQR